MIKYLIIFFSFLLPCISNAQTANAGSDQTIYLTNGNTATLDGSASSGSTYAWSEVSTDYSSGATITNGTTKTATLSGLKQGVWYFKLSVTTGGSTVNDITTVTVDYALPPNTGTLLRNLEMANSTIYNYINDRSNTSQLSGSPSGVTTSQGTYYFDRERSNSMFIDAQKAKFYSTIEDGYGWQSVQTYGRTEGSFGTGWTFDTTKIYVLEWKGYYPQDFSYLASNQTVGALMQIHSNAGTSPPFGFSILNGIDGGNSHRGTPGFKGLYFSDIYPSTNTAGYYLLLPLDSMYNKTHTIRLVMREGADNPILKCYVDGVEKYSRTTGAMSSTPNQDYPKFATVYDYENAITDPANHTRGRVFSMVTEAYNIYQITDTSGSVIAAPTANAGSNQTITLPTSSVSLSGSSTHATGYTNTYSWSKVSGSGSPTISGGTTLTPTISGFTVADTYVYSLTVTQSDGQVATDNVTITVNSAIAAPTISAGTDQSITVSTVSLAGSATWASTHSGTLLWTKEVGPSVTITSPTSASTSATGLANGEYRFRLTGTQDDSQTASDTVHVSVNIPVVPPPTVSAGSDKTITLPTNSIAQTGSATAASGKTMTGYLWTKVSGPGTQSIAGNTTLSATITGLSTVGTYVFNLKGTQSDGQYTNSTVTFTVNAAPIQIITVQIKKVPSIYLNK